MIPQGIVIAPSNLIGMGQATNTLPKAGTMLRAFTQEQLRHFIQD